MIKTSQKKLIILILIIVSLVSYSCTNDSLSDLSLTTDNPSPTGTVTYNANVKSILSQQCTSCHGSTNPSAGLDLSNYTSAKNHIGSIISRIDLQSGQSGIMPPSGRMSESYIQTIKNWQTHGLLEQ